MKVSFLFPSTRHRIGGVVALYHFANGLARRGHAVRFVHGPAWKDRIDSLDSLDWFPFEQSIEHFIADSLDDPALPASDVIFSPFGPSRLGHQGVFVQGFQMLPLAMEQAAYRIRGPKICVARWLVDVGLGMGVPREQLWHVPYGIDHELFAVRTPLTDRRFDVAMLYNAHPQKGWHVGAQALEILKEQRPDLRAVVFGVEVPPQLASWVEWRQSPGHRTLAEEIYNDSRVFVQTSNVEGFGFTAVEAMACGAALVTTDNGGAGDYATDGLTAVTVPVGDHEAMARETESLLGDDERRRAIATTGEQFVRRFEWDRSAAILEARLEEYLADPPAYQRPPADVELPSGTEGGSLEMWRAFTEEP